MRVIKVLLIILDKNVMNKIGDEIRSLQFRQTGKAAKHWDVKIYKTTNTKGAKNIYKRKISRPDIVAIDIKVSTNLGPMVERIIQKANNPTIISVEKDKHGRINTVGTIESIHQQINYLHSQQQGSRG